jgi:hypothetical protein
MRLGKPLSRFPRHKPRGLRPDRRDRPRPGEPLLTGPGTIAGTNDIEERLPCGAVA